MEQLDLFGNAMDMDLLPPGGALVESAEQAEVPCSLEGQLDLFSGPVVRSLEAQSKLERFELWAGAIELGWAVVAYPSDSSLRDRADQVSRLAARFEAERMRRGSQVAALLSIASAVPTYLQQSWHRCLARALEAEGGKGAVHVGGPAGLHFRLGGELEAAEVSLRTSLDLHPADARLRSYLADVWSLLGRPKQARLYYRDACACTPCRVDWARIADEEVAQLPHVAELDYEVTGDPQTWAAAIGLLERVFIPPEQAPIRAGAESDVAPGLRFYDWLVRDLAAANHDEHLVARRAMKALDAQLFDHYLHHRFG